MATPTRLLTEVLDLPRAERAELATRLLHSLDDEADVSTDEAAWARELERRAAAVADGTAELVPWDEFRAALHADLKARRDASGR
jgi:putative addiction module component (TIGR02574 family)